MNKEIIIWSLFLLDVALIMFLISSMLIHKFEIILDGFRLLGAKI